MPFVVTGVSIFFGKPENDSSTDANIVVKYASLESLYLYFASLLKLSESWEVRVLAGGCRRVLALHIWEIKVQLSARKPPILTRTLMFFLSLSRQMAGHYVN